MENRSEKISFANKRDLLIISAVFAVSLGAVFMSKSGNAEGTSAVITVGNEVVKTVDFAVVDRDSKDRTFEVGGISGAVFNVSERRIRVLHSDCPDKICVKTGFISKPGEVIICLPKKIAVRIDGNNEIDAVIG